MKRVIVWGGNLNRQIDFGFDSNPYWRRHLEAGTGKVTKDMFGFRSMGGSCGADSEACLALIHRDRVMLASFSSLLKLLISALSTSISCLSLPFSWMASCACMSSSSVFFLFISLDRLAAWLFLFLLSQYFVSFLSSGMGCLLFLWGWSMSDREHWSLLGLAVE